MPSRSTLWLRPLVLLFQLAPCGGGGGGGNQPGGDSGLSISTPPLDFPAVDGRRTPSAQTIPVPLSHRATHCVGVGVPPGTTVPPWLDLTLTGSGSSWTLGVQ